jgi:HTH DNA binding domain
LQVRIAGLIDAVAESARLAGADLQRLTLAREVMMRRCENRRGQLVDLFMASPLVTTQLAAQKLGVTPQAVEVMLRELGPSLPRELTGRKRYRAWGIV